MKGTYLIGIVAVLAIIVGWSPFWNVFNPTSRPTDESSVPAIEYTNAEYGFRLTLPQGWQGYTVVTDTWVGQHMDGAPEDRGTTITVRHPAWTAERPRQDIPIMIFPYDAWELIQTEQLSVSAAPIPPTELGRNNRYIFALPARYNYAFPEGFEEVERIIANTPLTTFDVVNK